MILFEEHLKKHENILWVLQIQSLVYWNQFIKSKKIKDKCYHIFHVDELMLTFLS